MKYTKIDIISPLPAPFFIGSQVRGALGYALKRAVCINPKGVCEGCFASANCLYSEFYAEKNSYHRYRLDYELGAKSYDFSVILFGEACAKTPYLLSAIYLVLTQIGLGKDRQKHDKFGIFINDVSCYKNETLNMPDSWENEIKFELSTPPKS